MSFSQARYLKKHEERYRIDHGADHEVEDEDEYTALDLAKHYQHSNVIKILADMPTSAPPPTDDDPYNSDEEDEDWEDSDWLYYQGRGRRLVGDKCM